MSAKWKNLASRFRGFGKECSRYERIALWGILLLGLLFAFAAFFYGDIESTFDNTVLFVKSIRDGAFFHFYEYSLEHAATYWPAGYDLLLYVFFAIWNLPSIILHLITGYSYLESPIALLWCKGMTVFFAAGMAWVLYKIVRLLDFEKKDGILAAFLMLSSLSLVAPVFIAGQYDTLPLFFMLLGLYFYLKEKPFYFYLCFFISIPLKVYGLFLLIPLILLKEKRIAAILGKTTGTCLLYLFMKAIFVNDSAYAFISGSQGAYGTNKLLSSAVEYSGYSLCLFLGTYAAICIFCYYKKLFGMQEKIIYPVYICFLVFACFVTLVAINDYWIIFYLPFAVILIILNKKCYKINILLETAAGGMYLLYAFINKIYPYSYPELVTERFIEIFTEVPDEGLRLYGSVKAFMEYIGLQPYAGLVHTLFVVAMVSLVILNRPQTIKKVSEQEDREETVREEKETGILWSRVAAVFFTIFVLLYANLKSGNPILYSTMNSNNTQSDINLLDGAVFTQDLIFHGDYCLDELTLYFANNGYVKDNFGSVWIRLKEKETGKILMEKRVGASMTESGMPCRVSLSGIETGAEKVYTLCLEGVPGIEGSEYFFTPYITEGFVGENPAAVNGETQDYQLYMQIR